MRERETAQMTTALLQPFFSTFWSARTFVYPKLNRNWLFMRSCSASSELHLFFFCRSFVQQADANYIHRETTKFPVGIAFVQFCAEQHLPIHVYDIIFYMIVVNDCLSRRRHRLLYSTARRKMLLEPTERKIPNFHSTIWLTSQSLQKLSKTFNGLNQIGIACTRVYYYELQAVFHFWKNCYCYIIHISLCQFILCCAICNFFHYYYHHCWFLFPT